MKKHKAVLLSDSEVDYLSELGGGMASVGLRRLIRWAQSRREEVIADLGLTSLRSTLERDADRVSEAVGMALAGRLKPARPTEMHAVRAGLVPRSMALRGSKLTKERFGAAVDYLMARTGLVAFRRPESAMMVFAWDTKLATDRPAGWAGLASL
jgi:hypothetical protein